MLLKGSRMKSLYPRPELRIMGDADVLIRMEQYDAIEKIMQELGYQKGIGAEHELVWKNPSLYLELHKCPLPANNPDLYAWFGDGWRHAARCEGSRWFMSPEDETVYMFAHFAKHFRNGGIGLRHIVDLWVWLRANPNLDDSYIQNAFNQLGIREFCVHIHRLIKHWFECGEVDAKLEAIGEYIFASGNWGTAEMRTLGWATLVEKDRAHQARGKLAYLLRKIFPHMHKLRKEYPVLQKAPWLLPLILIYRPFYKVFSEHKSLAWEFRKAKMVNRQNLDQRQQFLHSVGLDYNW